MVEFTTVHITSSKSGHRCEILFSTLFQSKLTMSGYWFFLRIDGVVFVHSSLQWSSSSCHNFALNNIFKDDTLYRMDTTTEGTLVFAAFITSTTVSISKTSVADLVIWVVYEVIKSIKSIVNSVGEVHFHQTHWGFIADF